ncbi:hypothetical protein C9J48_17710 [Photobacterium profundum]|uniref:ATP-grasp domain-containing protein n=1 Tax=Photobacterium profundum 3TCK TaxID=314280 RepID=Q1Z869_9GAMM|nr:hypothetical protein [Photobacterium profundum]EAS44644.1 hypothetical protein P3TCK_26762 [Photobacterium profundum 3TCK]PSV60636.1 hypothetical protein C9J48_17710 [Photobacterium profundum]
MNKVVFVTNYNNIIPQKLHETIGIDPSVMVNFFSNDISSEVLSFDDIANKVINNSIDIDGVYFFFCSSQIEQYKLAVIDVAFEINARGGILLPSIEHYLSHENKYYQELYKSRVGISTPKSKILSHYNSEKLKSNLPVVVKPYAGFGSKGVTLAKTSGDLKKSIRTNMGYYIFHNKSIIEIARSFIKQYIKHPQSYPLKFGRVVLQEFIPDLKFDWKVLVFDNKVFVLKRFTRDDDFRASGSGKFDYHCVADDKLIKFAVETRKKLNTPFVSLDISESSLGYSIIEYQSVHFGLATAINAQYEYVYSHESIIKRDKSFDNVEMLFAQSISSFIRGR